MIPPKLENALKKEYNITPELTGSQFICIPAPSGSDWDYLVEAPKIESEISSLVSFLTNEGFQWEGGEHYQMTITADFMSFRFKEINLLVSANAEWCKKHRLATKLAKKLNLQEKPDRIAVFQAILYGNVE